MKNKGTVCSRSEKGERNGFISVRRWRNHSRRDRGKHASANGQARAARPSNQEGDRETDAGGCLPQFFASASKSAHIDWAAADDALEGAICMKIGNSDKAMSTLPTVADRNPVTCRLNSPNSRSSPVLSSMAHWTIERRQLRSAKGWYCDRVLTYDR